MNKKYTYEELQEENVKLLKELKRKKQKLTQALQQLKEQNKVLVENNRHISDSINYAYRIQGALMPPDYYVKNILPDSFIVYMPQATVSGDFYFVGKIKDETLFSAVDCTGHGVPGALMSVLGFNCIEQAVNEKNITNPAEILKYLDIGVTKMLRQAGEESGVNDGMDLCFCTVNLETRKLQFAGAFNPLYILKGNGIELPGVEEFRQEREKCDDSSEQAHPMNTPVPFEDNLTGYLIKADKFPIGVNTDGVADNYTTHSVTLKEGNTIYLLSDGYADQFGGPKNKKYGYKRLRKLLASIQNQPMHEQKISLETEIKTWMGDTEQVDDILIMGVRL